MTERATLELAGGLKPTLELVGCQLRTPTIVRHLQEKPTLDPAAGDHGCELEGPTQAWVQLLEHRGGNREDETLTRGTTQEQALEQKVE